MESWLTSSGWGRMCGLQLLAAQDPERVATLRVRIKVLRQHQFHNRSNLLEGIRKLVPISNTAVFLSEIST